MLEISNYSELDRDEIIALVLHCQNDGTRPFVTVKDQPELLSIKEKFMDGGGNFWVAKEQGKVAGSIGLMKFNNDLAVLKKFFVYDSFRGAPYHLGSKLYAALLEFAKAKEIKKIILDTPKNTDRAHDFYYKAGFKQIQKEQIAIIYDYPYEDSDFFCLDL